MRIKWNRHLDGNSTRRQQDESGEVEAESKKRGASSHSLFRIFRRKKHRHRSDNHGGGEGNLLPSPATPAPSDDDDCASVSSVATCASQPTAGVHHRDRTLSLFSSFRLSLPGSKRKKRSILPTPSDTSLADHPKGSEKSRYSTPDLRKPTTCASDDVQAGLSTSSPSVPNESSNSFLHLAELRTQNAESLDRLKVSDSRLPKSVSFSDCHREESSDCSPRDNKSLRDDRSQATVVHGHYGSADDETLARPNGKSGDGWECEPNIAHSSDPIAFSYCPGEVRADEESFAILSNAAKVNVKTKNVRSASDISDIFDNIASDIYNSTLPENRQFSEANTSVRISEWNTTSVSEKKQDDEGNFFVNNPHPQDFSGKCHLSVVSEFGKPLIIPHHRDNISESLSNPVIRDPIACDISEDSQDFFPSVVNDEAPLLRENKTSDEFQNGAFSDSEGDIGVNGHYVTRLQGSECPFRLPEEARLVEVPSSPECGSSRNRENVVGLGKLSSDESETSFNCIPFPSEVSERRKKRGLDLNVSFLYPDFRNQGPIFPKSTDSFELSTYGRSGSLERLRGSEGKARDSPFLLGPYRGVTFKWYTPFLVKQYDNYENRGKSCSDFSSDIDGIDHASIRGKNGCQERCPAAPSTSARLEGLPTTVTACDSDLRVQGAVATHRLSLPVVESRDGRTEKLLSGPEMLSNASLALGDLGGLFGTEASHDKSPVILCTEIRNDFAGVRDPVVYSDTDILGSNCFPGSVYRGPHNSCQAAGIRDISRRQCATHVSCAHPSTLKNSAKNSYCDDFQKSSHIISTLKFLCADKNDAATVDECFNSPVSRENVVGDENTFSKTHGKSVVRSESKAGRSSVCPIAASCNGDTLTDFTSEGAFIQEKSSATYLDENLAFKRNDLPSFKQYSLPDSGNKNRSPKNKISMIPFRKKENCKISRTLELEQKLKTEHSTSSDGNAKNTAVEDAVLECQSHSDFPSLLTNGTPLVKNCYNDDSESDNSSDSDAARNPSEKREPCLKSVSGNHEVLSTFLAFPKNTVSQFGNNSETNTSNISEKCKSEEILSPAFWNLCSVEPRNLECGVFPNGSGSDETGMKHTVNAPLVIEAAEIPMHKALSYSKDLASVACKEFSTKDVINSNTLNAPPASEKELHFVNCFRSELSLCPIVRTPGRQQNSVRCGLQSSYSSLPAAVGQVRKLSTSKESVNLTQRNNLTWRRKSGIPIKQGRGTSAKAPMWLSRAELTQEIQRLGNLCEARTKELNRLKMETKHVTVGFDAFAALFKYMVEDLNVLSIPKLTEDLEKTLKQLEVTKQDLAYYEKEIEEIKAHHCQELNDLSNKLFEVYQSEVAELNSKHQEEINQLKNDHKIQVENLTATFQASSEEIQSQHEIIIASLRQEIFNQREELQLYQKREIKDLEEKHAQSIKVLQEHTEQLQKKYAELKQHSVSMEDAMRKDTDSKLQWVTTRKSDLEKEVESLKTVLEMKNKELHSLRVQTLEMEKQLEELPFAKEKIKMLQARAEDLEALMVEKTKLERKLCSENQQIKETCEKEAKVNRRLSMENEELQWRLRQAEQSLISGSFMEVVESPEETENTAASPVKSPSPQMLSRSVFFTFVDKDESSPRSQYKKITPGFAASYKTSPCKGSKSPPTQSPRKAKSHSEPPPPGGFCSTPRKVSKQSTTKNKGFQKRQRSGSDCGRQNNEQIDINFLSVTESMASSVSSESSVFEHKERLLEEHKDQIMASLEILREQRSTESDTKESLMPSGTNKKWCNDDSTIVYESSNFEAKDMSRSAEFADPKSYYHMTFPVLKESGITDCDIEDGSKVSSSGSSPMKEAVPMHSMSESSLNKKSKNTQINSKFMSISSPEIWAASIDSTRKACLRPAVSANDMQKAKIGKNMV